MVSRSNAESEYRATTDLICNLVWVKDLLMELSFTLESPMRMYYDNQTAIYIVENHVLHERTKHIEIDLLFGAPEGGRG